MSGKCTLEQLRWSRSSSVERDDNFEILCFEDDSDSESDSFAEVTAEEINSLENGEEEDTFSLINLPSLVVKYHDHAEELQEDDIYFVIGNGEEEESERSSEELQEIDNSRCIENSTKVESEANNNEVLLEDNQREAEEESENSEVEYNFPDLDREEMYLKARPYGLGQRKRCTRSILKLKGLRNVVRVM